MEAGGCRPVLGACMGARGCRPVLGSLHGGRGLPGQVVWRPGAVDQSQARLHACRQRGNATSTTDDRPLAVILVPLFLALSR
eukprot:362070-Chlamydomonas_euryale.AAC.3